MTLSKRVKEASTVAATEACLRERSRILWLLDEILDRMRQDLAKKILIEQQRHMVETKIKIATAIFNQVKVGVIAGTRPPKPLKELHVPVRDVDEMGIRVANLRDLLLELGFDEDSTIDDVKKQIKVWDEQEDRITELEAKLNGECG